METAAYDYLRVSLQKKEALLLYYRLTAFLREHDPNAFRRFMDFRDGSLRDEALMGFVLGIGRATCYRYISQATST
jgi:hypothetical protein